MEKEYKMSAARAQELQEELNYLKTTRSDEVAEQIKVARGFCDLSENSEYDAATNEQRTLYRRVLMQKGISLHDFLACHTRTWILYGRNRLITDEKYSKYKQNANEKQTCYNYLIFFQTSIFFHVIDSTFR